MRRIALIAAVAVTMLPLAGFAQQLPGTVPSETTVGVAPSGPAGAPGPDVVPQPGGPLNPGTQTGRDVVASDGISTETVRPFPAARSPAKPMAAPPASGFRIDRREGAKSLRMSDD